MGLSPIVAKSLRRLVAVLTLVAAAQLSVACQDKQGSPDPSSSAAMAVGAGTLCSLSDRPVGERNPLDFRVGVERVWVYATDDQVAAVELGRTYRFTYDSATHELVSIEAYGGTDPDFGVCA